MGTQVKRKWYGKTDLPTVCRKKSVSQNYIKNPLINLKTETVSVLLSSQIPIKIGRLALSLTMNTLLNDGFSYIVYFFYFGHCFCPEINFLHIIKKKEKKKK